MKVELHMIQNFAPACLNRDDTNSPKDCEFGGVRRARISSQCIKRAIRKAFREDGLLRPDDLAFRTKKLVDHVSRRLAQAGKDEDEARSVVEAALQCMKLKVTKDSKTEYLLFLGKKEIDALFESCNRHWDQLCNAPRAGTDDDKSGQGRKRAKKSAKDIVADEVSEALEKVLAGNTAADVALFGRMLADLPERNIDAACQVAHAISTNKVAMEMDYYTAVDDLKDRAEEDVGAEMIGVIGYNSACFYRYSLVDWNQLVSNLGHDRDLATRTLEAFIRASALALPTGKQNTFAAHSPPDFILATVRSRGAPLSLVNAFARPARPTQAEDLIQVSVNLMADYWAKIQRIYGDKEDLTVRSYCGTVEPSDGNLDWEKLDDLGGLVEVVLNAVKQEGGA